MYEIGLKKIKCIIKDSFAADSDEPYVLVFTVDLKRAINSGVKGSTRMTLYGPWTGSNSMDGGDVRVIASGDIVWGVNNQPKGIQSINDVIILVGLLESDHDQDDCEIVRVQVHEEIVKSLTGLPFNAMTHANLTEALRKEFQHRIDVERLSPTNTSGDLEHDERLGSAKVLPLTAGKLTDAHDKVVDVVLKFTNADKDFEYDLTFGIGYGAGSISKNLGSDRNAVDPDLDPYRPAAVIDAAGIKLDIISRETGSAFAGRIDSSNGGVTWLRKFEIGAGVFTSGMAAAVSSDGNNLYVFGRGNDNRYWRAVSHNGGATWNVGWSPVGNRTFDSAPAAVTAHADDLHIFGRRDDNRIWQRRSTDGGSTWTIWEPIGDKTFTSAPAAVVSADSAQIHVFARASDNRIWRTFLPNSGSSWSVGWEPIGNGLFTSAPAAVLSADGQQLHVLGRGNDKRYWRAFSSDGGAHWALAWEPIGAGLFSSGPSAAMSADGKKLHVFGRGLYPPIPPPGEFADPQEPRIWRAFSPNGGASWRVAWSAIHPQLVSD